MKPEKETEPMFFNLNRFRKTLANAALVSLIAGGVMAQSEPERPQNEILEADIVAEAITLKAQEFGAEIIKMRTALKDLPDDLAGAEAVFDEMVAEVQGLIEEMRSAEGGIATGVNTLEGQASEWREYWRTLCENTSNSRDCERVGLWETRVAASVETTVRYDNMLSGMQALIDALNNEKPYVLDDIRLAFFDAALNTINSSLDKLEEMRTDLESFGVEVAESDDAREGN